ncbi:xyloglucan-specific galacturonosyltransferase 1 [Malania oleifera]|uniref:xyloglucan-specific galacturonosyltransferase 1 n=1 Tax=Malania oleifera TaxID=397392 RepID=UPI0025AE91AD|nr:xyloglucan-specific galacturonosyltransferase 1 [Malania oleifera]
MQPSPTMAIAVPTIESKEFGFHDSTLLPKFMYRIPIVILLVTPLLLWSSSTTIISNSIVHICISSRKLNHLYCLSAGAEPASRSPNASSISPGNSTGHALIDHHFFGEDNPALPINKSSFFSNYKDEGVVTAVKHVEEQVQAHRSWASGANDHVGCEGRGIFVYDLPSKFNKDLVAQCNDMVPWTNLCEYFANEALGEQLPELGNGWYKTHQYSLEIIFHSRVLKHPCRVYDPNEAKLFYVPFYGGLDILRWHFKNVTNQVKDSLGQELVRWLDGRPPWVRNSGKDHVFVLGKVSWDFRRRGDSPWGTRLLELNQMQNPIKVLIERQPWHLNDVGVPHPTHFHPRSDADIIAWQLRIMRADRRSLTGFAAGERPGLPENIRSLLIKHCISAGEGKCRFLDCNSGDCAQPESVIRLFMESEFCLQPPGDSPTRKSLFDSLVSGCIPVLFDPFTAYYQYPWHLPEEHGKYSVFIYQEEVREMKVDVVEKLMRISVKEKEEMRRYIVYELLPGLVYGASDSRLEKFQDAFTITMNNLLQRVSRLE